MLALLLAQAADPASGIAAGLATHPLTYLCALLILAVVYLYKESQAKSAAMIALVKESGDKQAATLEKVLPLTEKLASTVETAERLLLKDNK